MKVLELVKSQKKTILTTLALAAIGAITKQVRAHYMQGKLKKQHA